MIHSSALTPLGTHWCVVVAIKNGKENQNEIDWSRFKEHSHGISLSEVITIKAYGTGQLFRRAAIVRDRILAITDIWNSRPKSNLPPTEPAAVQESERRLRSSPCRRAARPSRGRAATVSQDCYLQPGCSFLHHHYSRLCPQTLMSRPSLQTWLPSLAAPAIAVMTERLPWSRLLLLSYLWLQADSEMPRHN